jgi:ubiquinone biosynthesis monooxygenase Coq6
MCACNRLVVGADGGQSFVRRQAGIATSGWGYGQDAVVATVKVLQSDFSSPDGSTTAFDPSAHTAWQRYLSTGPLALLPLWGPYRSIVWSLPTAEATKMKSLSEEEFVQLLNVALQSLPNKPTVADQPSIGSQLYDLYDGVRKRSPSKTILSGASLAARPYRDIANNVVALGDTLVSAALSLNPQKVPPLIEAMASPRLSFPLQLQQAGAYSAPRVALIGDAAHMIHPQAGQGLNLGLQDAEDLARVIAAAVDRGVDVGDNAVIKSEYASKASRRAATMLQGVDTINTLFSRGNERSATESVLKKLASTAREVYPNFERDYSMILSLGLTGVQMSGEVKKLLARKAMGLD